MSRLLQYLTGPLARKLAVGFGFLAAVILLLIWLAGGFHQKIDRTAPGGKDQIATGGSNADIADLHTAVVTIRQVPRVETASGSVRAVHEISTASKLLAKVMTVNVTAGQRVAKGDVLIQLDDEDLKSRVEQARAEASSLRATRDQAKIENDRIEKLHAQNVATSIEWERASSAYKAAESNYQSAEQRVREAETILGYATILAPIDGVVVEKKVEAGDTVTPGQVLLTLYDPTRMQLIAGVRESLARRLRVGQPLQIRLETMDHACEGSISEIVPTAESESRTIPVKVVGPCPPGVYPGMFGRLLIPLESEPVLVIPAGAVRRVGQLDLVRVVADGEVQRRAVKLGRALDGEIEILSGLREGERVVVENT
ncbi:MAG: efflux RND transporter periplasmic adaptor subunit [Phycisphaerales bacterium]|nr:efflux RND transporter periplasmic adaptor subunit [Phycisphaerales bacterium]MCB9864577.1 efflux RND transporter periplasmic adaptor subunit [Phycisphaerales bacterium]